MGTNISEELDAYMLSLTHARVYPEDTDSKISRNVDSHLQE